MFRFILLLCLLLPLAGIAADGDLYPFESQDEQDRFRTLTKELRCPKCQNQNIADSDAPIAKDMREEVYRMVKEGSSNDEVVDSLVSRFGEFVRYKPEFDGRTLMLWATPVIVVLMGLGIVISIVVRSRRNTETDSALSPEQRQRADRILKDSDPQ
ncbi:cytochrome c-type biogenesis protein [Marinobacter salicampi]|uniref:cytochrome c-type biogenesis protein n=1 Tax=Marinobacter salicampi TaxID=435907 RepID=UPI00140C0D9D|nr:cytochrome c-type biogenesis protein [Marinobacter salicampi]